MIGYVNGERVDLTRKVVNPNLIKNSKNYVVGGLMQNTPFGTFYNITDYSKEYSLYLNGGTENDGFHADNTTYFPLEKNTYYTETIWFTTDREIVPDFGSGLVFYGYQGSGVLMSDIKTADLGNNHYKVSGYFNSQTQTSIDLLYIIGFNTALKTNQPIKVKFDKMKLEKGTESTDWCPAYDDYVMQSDLDDLKAQIEQLKSK